MKFFLVALAATFATANAADCSTTLLSTLLADTNLETCGTDGGYDFTTGVKPTETQAEAMCSSTACQTLLADVMATNPTECTIPLGDKINLLSDLVYYVADICGIDVGQSSTSSTGSGSTATATVTVTSSSGSTTIETETPSTTEAASSEASASTAGSVEASSGSSPASIATISAAAAAVASVAAFML